MRGDLRGQQIAGDLRHPVCRLPSARWRNGDVRRHRLRHRLWSADAEAMRDRGNLHPSTGCCDNADCPTNAGGQTGTCDSGTHTCNYSCTGSTKSCTSGSTTVCIPSTGCCTNSDCTGNCMMCNTSTHTCAAAKSMDDPNGRCAGTCDSAGACKAKQGQTCSVAGDCITGFCADKVCCNSACTGSCEYCAGTPAGTCAFVSGAPKTGHAACGGTGSCAGSCDGTKATCKMPGSETVCLAMSCTSGTMTNPSVCNGAGSCPTATTTSCGNYACNGATSCYTTCSQPSQCAANTICSGASQCVKCPTGQNVCANGCYDTNNDASHCGATACKVCVDSTPSCAGGTCTCRVQSSNNKLLNAGFNSNVTSWSAGVDTTFDKSTDAEGCAGSGSALFSNNSGGLSQCVSMGLKAGQAYQFGILFKGTGTLYCSVNYYTAVNCDSSFYNGRYAVYVTPPSATGWVPGTIYSNLPVGTLSMSVYCSGNQANGNVDQLYFNQEGGAF